MSLQCLLARIGVVISFILSVLIMLAGIVFVFAGLICAVVAMIALFISPPPATLPIVGVLVVLFLALEILSMPLLLIGGLGFGGSFFLASIAEEICAPSA